MDLVELARLFWMKPSRNCANATSQGSDAFSNSIMADRKEHRSTLGFIESVASLWSVLACSVDSRLDQSLNKNLNRCRASRGRRKPAPSCRLSPISQREHTCRLPKTDLSIRTIYQYLIVQVTSRVLKLSKRVGLDRLLQSAGESQKSAISPRGSIIGVIQKDSKYRPARGIIAQLGVFPEFRRRGIGMVLIDELFRVFKQHGCAYSFVGTPKANDPALELYCKMDHSPIFEQMDFCRII